MQVSDRNRDQRSILVLAVVCGVLQLALAPNIGLGNGRANFALIFSVCISLMVGGRKSVLAGFCAGLFFDLSTTGPIGLMSLLLCVSSYVMGLEGRNRVSGDLGLTTGSFAAHALAVSLAYHIAMLLVGQASGFVDVIFLRTLPTAFLTIIAFIPFAVWLTRAQPSGPSLGGGRGRSSHGSHLDMRGL